MNKLFSTIILGALLINTSVTIANDGSSTIISSDQKELNTHAMTDIQGMMARYTAYNLWANQQMANWLKDIPEELFDQEVESSFTSLRKTLIHIWNAEYGWLRSVKSERWGDSPGKDFSGNGKALLDGLLEASLAFKDHIAGMSAEQLSDGVDTSSWSASYAEMVHHCMNHSTYHRGQLITMGRQLGLESPPRTDFIYFINLK